MATLFRNVGRVVVVVVVVGTVVVPAGRGLIAVV